MVQAQPTEIFVPELLCYAWVLASLFTLVAWFVQRALQNAAIVDANWALGFALVAMGFALATSGDPARRFLVACMAGIWGLRLALYVLADRIIGKPEDARYRRLRERWGGRAQLYFFLLFQFEALGVPLFALPLLVLMQNTNPQFSAWEWAGLGLWLLAITGEWLADRQLARFRANPQNSGKTCRDGLWRYSRHPNYFFESLIWWSYVLMSVDAPYGWVTLVAPIVMTFSLLKVSGIPFAETQAVASRGDDYREYQHTTSAFIPWFPKKT